jgi:membrane-associated phospholipid phosphatase
MFRTDFNHFLQSLDFPLLYKFMYNVSILGTVYMIFLAVIILIAGINFRKGFLILNIVGWGAIIMLGAKGFIDYPRPIAVASNLNSFGLAKTSDNFQDIQPLGFFEIFSNELLEKTRSNEIGRYGFPSGHVILITTIWMSMAMMFKRGWLTMISILVISLTAVSRMYLGLHYLGDVIGGLFIGIVLTIVFTKLFEKLSLTKSKSLTINGLFIFLLPLLLFFLSSITPGFQGGALIGFNMAFLLIIKLNGVPELSPQIVRRIVNVLFFVVVFFASFFMSKQLQLPKLGLLSMVVFAIINFTVVMVFFYIGYWLKFYRLDTHEKLN